MYFMGIPQGLTPFSVRIFMKYFSALAFVAICFILVYVKSSKEPVVVSKQTILLEKSEMVGNEDEAIQDDAANEKKRVRSLD